MCYPADKLSDNVLSSICFPLGWIKYFLQVINGGEKLNPKPKKAQPQTPPCYNN